VGSNLPSQETEVREPLGQPTDNIPVRLDCKNYSELAYSFPRDWRLSASWGPIEGSPRTPRTSRHYGIDGFKRGTPLCRESSVSSRGRFFRYIIIMHTHAEKSFRNVHRIKPKSDCIYYFPIDFEQQTDTSVRFQINRCMVNTI